MFIPQYCHDGEATPIQRAIMEGDKNTGISLMKIVKELDSGLFIFKEIPINSK